MTKTEKEEFPTVAELQQKILSLKPDPKKVAAKERKNQRKKKPKAKTKEELEHLDLKQRLLEKENENFSKIYFLKTADNWGWQAFDNSALFFEDYIARKLEIPPRLKVDDDYDCRAKKGTVFVREMGEFETKLKAIGIKASFKNENTIVFDLDKEFSEEEIEKIILSDEERWRRANDVVATAKRLYPNLAAKMRETMQMYYNMIKKMNVFGREVAGVKVMRLLYEMDVAFDAALKSGKNVLKTLEKMSEDEEQLESMLAALSDLRDLSPEEISKMGFQLQKLKDEIKKALRKEKKRGGQKRAANS